MNLTDLFVGTVSIGAGSCLVAAGIANWEAWYQSWKIRWLVRSFGRTSARAVYVGVGLFFIVLGIAIAGNISSSIL